MPIRGAPPPAGMNIAMVTAGGAGMFCGSCMHDNTWARALIAEGADVSLIPTYTPIRVDEQDESLHRVFLGGINIYLNSRFQWWHHMPHAVRAWLDDPGIIRWATRWSISNDAHQLGDLAVSMLHGEQGPHRQAVEELARFLQNDLKPDVVIFSNSLLSGALHVIKEHLDVPVLCTLQGEDVFLDSLPDRHRAQVLELITARAREFDGFLVHSRFYRDYMAKYLSLDVERCSILPLGIDVDSHPGQPEIKNNEAYTVGYFARIAPEKGLHHLVEAFPLLREMIPDARLRIGGFLGKQDRSYFKGVMKKLKKFGNAVEYIGSPTSHAEKVAFLNSIDVLSVPTEFLEPKGIYVLEAMANGVPVVQPLHAAFPELIEKTGGGLLVTPRHPQSLAAGLHRLSNPEERLHYARNAWQGVREHYACRAMAVQTLETLHSYFEAAPQATGAPERGTSSLPIPDRSSTESGKVP